jgi:signal transduction histidine kinase
LRQVALNLALNAIEATPPGGVVRLEARAATQGHDVLIAVVDQGPGLPEPLRTRVFEPFFSTKPGRPGGLGLAISRRIVDEAGGAIEISDRPGGGAVFVLRLPAA